jgi:ubiquitin C-terminal hydrolase
MGGCKSKPISSPPSAGKTNINLSLHEHEQQQQRPSSTSQHLMDQLGTDIDMLPGQKNTQQQQQMLGNKSSSSSAAASSSPSKQKQRTKTPQQPALVARASSAPTSSSSSSPSSRPHPPINQRQISSSSFFHHDNNNSNDDNNDVNAPQTDPLWSELFTILHPYLLDPEDLTSTLDATISKMIDQLSPVEVSFIRRRVKLSIRAIVHNSEGNGCYFYDGGGLGNGPGAGSSTSGGGNAGSSGGGGRSISLSKKMGRLLGKEGDKYSSSSASSSLYNYNNDASSSSSSSSPSYHTHPALLYESSTSMDSRIKTSKLIYQKERLIDITIMRKIFEGGERCLRDMHLQIRTSRRNNKRVSSTQQHQQQHGDNVDMLVFALEDSARQQQQHHHQQQQQKQQQQQYDALEKIDIYGSAYLLLIYMSEARWDYVTEIARLSAQRAGLTLDVNKLALQESEREKNGAFLSASTPKMLSKVGDKKEENGRINHSSSQQQQGQPFSQNIVSIPSSPSPSTKSPSELYNNPDLTTNEPGGVHFTLLCYLIALALRGTRRQKLNLLFHLLLPPKELDVLLSSHPAGGLPTWLLEVDGDVVFSFDSLSYYYNYEGVMLPSERHLLKCRTISKGSDRRRKKLCVDACSVVEILATILSGSGLSSSSTDKESYGMRRLSDTISAHLDSEGEQRVAGDASSSKQYQNVNEMLCQEIGGGREPTKYEQNSLKGFIDKSNRVLSSGHILWSMREFVTWADTAIDETVLDKIMRNLFGTGIVPSAKLEHTLVTQRWINWNMQEEFDHVDPLRERDDTASPKSRFHKKIFASDESQHSQDSHSSNNLDSVWGGIGGTDGKGGLGHGVLYCIEKSWWDDWVAYTGWKAAEGNVFNPTSLRRPRELSTERLIDRSIEAISMSGTRGSYELMKQKLSPGKHYVLIPPGVWNVLYEMYGGGPPLPRMVLPSGCEEDIVINGVQKGFISADDESVEVSSVMHDNAEVRYPKAIAKTVRVATHPWILHCQICDPQQPYRRGDLGPMSIRVMVMPDQPLWRLFAEIVARLPIILSKASDSNCEGRARLWKISSVNGKILNAGSRFGPWTLLCKNPYAEIPISTPNYDKYEEKWQSYCDQHSIQSIGLLDGTRVLFEYVVASKDGSFPWPREAAAKATQLRRIADEDANFRMLLRGYDSEGKPSCDPIMRKIVDAMDATGRWYQGLIVNVESGDKAAGHNDSNSPEDTDAPKDASFRENTHVRIHFKDHHENHEEWIEVKSDRLAVAGRFTSNANLESDIEGDAAIETKSILPVSKKKDSNDLMSNDQSHNALCLFPSYGACGLINLGNTCYANSGWQCLSYMPLLRFYLLSSQYKISGDINRDNPLGTGGKILEEFADLMRVMWSGKFGARAPQRFRSVLTKCRPRYSGANQQDVPELLTDILDMLHEDANRVKKKPFVEALEDKFLEKTDLQRIGQEAWRRYLRRNRSVITDLCMGQLFNLVTCPECNHSSKNFDPFNVLSLPLPTVDEVIFRCTVVRRATTLNCPNTLLLVGGSSKRKLNSLNQLSPPSKELIFEEYAIATSRLADLGDLKMKLQQLSGIPAKRLRLCKKEDIGTGIGDKHSMTRVYTKVVSLPEKEGPCLRLLNHTSSDDASSPTIATVVAFETTLQPRPETEMSVHSNGRRAAGTDGASTDDDTSSDTSSTQTAGDDQDWKSIEKMGEECLKVYGDENECVTFDTNPVPLAKYVSHCLWPNEAKDITMGLRVDAIDRRNNWYPGSVVDIVADKNEEGDRNISMVKVHFDNFSAKWDEVYSIGNSRIRPLYSHSTPRAKPTEFVVHHRSMEHKTKKFFLFGQSFYLQCHNEWSTARAGAHVLAQASRFLELSHFKKPENGKKFSSVERKIAEKERDEARKTIASIIKALIQSDKRYVIAAVENGKKQARQNENHSLLDTMSNDLTEKLSEVLPFLPFDVRVTTADSPLGTNSEEVAFPFSLIRTIGNYMNARHSIVLHWREKTDALNSNLASAKLLYIPPIVSPSKQNQKLLGASGNDELKRHPSSSHGGFHIGSCLAEFFKEQQLEATGCWRCPVCKEDREGKQSMALWNLPDFLVFHFKRFNASSRWSEKITTRVDFPITGLNMREWCDKNSPLSFQSSDEPFMYDLIGVVNHMGDIDTGHYIAACKATACSPDGNEEVAYNFNGWNTTTLDSTDEESTSSGGGWRLGRSKEKDSSTKAASKAVSESAEPLWLKFDDELVEPVPPRNVVTEAAYVLFYRRRRMHPSNVAKYSSLD